MKRHHRALLLPFTNGVTYTAKIQALGPIAYWPLSELSGTVALDVSGNARNGAYTGVTLGVTGIGDGSNGASFDGATSFCNVYSASFATAFNGQLGSLIGWFRIPTAGVWSDATTRRAVYLLVDANNRIGFLRPTTNNEIDWLYVAGSTSKTGGVTSFSPSTWFHLGLTWSKAADQVIFYVNGTQSGATATGLGTFAGALSSTQTILGSLSTTAAQVWSGHEAHVAVFDRVLSAAEVLKAATP